MLKDQAVRFHCLFHVAGVKLRIADAILGFGRKRIPRVIANQLLVFTNGFLVILILEIQIPQVVL